MKLQLKKTFESSHIESKKNHLLLKLLIISFLYEQMSSAKQYCCSKTIKKACDAF